MCGRVDNGKGKPTLLLGSQMAMGGSQQVLLRQSFWFFQRGYAVTAAFLYDKENLLSVWSEKYPFPIYDLGFARPKSNLVTQVVYFFRGLIRLLNLLRHEKFVAIETFTAHANLIGLPLAWIAGVPNRIGSHRGKIEGFSPLLERLNTLLINSPITTRLVAVSKRVEDDAVVEGIRPERIVRIANGIDIQKVDPAEILRVRNGLSVQSDDLVLLSVGRLMYQKGHTLLLKALPTVLAEFPNVLALIVGNGPLKDDLQAEAARLNISEQVKFLGFRDDVPVLMSAADMFLFPSRFEGMPNSVLEAMGYGLAVIATDVQGVDELIRNEENGIIVPVENTAAISRAILRLANSPEERRRLGRAAHDTIKQKYTLDAMCVQYERLLMAKSRRWS
jgi:hypothetical protein